MTHHKFTDDQIIRCLNECDGKENVVAHIVDQGEDELVTLGRILEIINRQKAEIEALTNAVDNSTKEFLSLHDAYQDQKAEIERLIVNMNAFGLGMKAEKERADNAIKEFAKFLIDNSTDGSIAISDLPDLVKEMTEGKT